MNRINIINNCVTYEIDKREIKEQKPPEQITVSVFTVASLELFAFSQLTHHVGSTSTGGIGLFWEFL